MFNWLRSSLPARAGVAVILIAILALASSLSAGLIAWFSQGDGAAINTAGSVRMETYHLSWKLADHAPADEIQAITQSLQRRLDSQSLKAVLEDGPHSALQQSYRQIQQHWNQELRPAIERDDGALFRERAPAFVEQLNQFVSLLQQQSEHKQGWQQLIQGLALFSTLIILLLGLYELQYGVVTPLKELVDATRRFREGDYQTRVNHRSQDELGQLALSFNTLAETIEQSHRTLESQVQQKTLNLQQANAALELLYESSRSLATRLANAEGLDELIRRFQKRLPGLRLSLCLQGHFLAPAQQMLALHGGNSRNVCAIGDCATCERHHVAPPQVFSISNQGAELGELKAHFVDGHAPQAWEQQLIQALANLIGTSLSLKRQREQDHRLLLLDERTIIARELHDSLAQALSYMKLQVSRMQTLLRRDEPKATLETVTGELREGLNNAYRQLRELLTTFRLQIHDAGLVQELKDTAEEFSRRGEFQVHLHVDALAFQLSASEQIHLLQVTREALSNCLRHAHAENAWLQLRQHGETVSLSIEDDGRGFSEPVDQREHHGLTIMDERARSLHGQLDISSREPQGTRVHLLFRPEFLGPSLQEGSLS
ncbi:MULTISPECIES: ATP-binding protein [Pseudomonas]|jgi:two-component system nitrate/nitrite sensor histidine kinase NarX|uniref:Sensor protein n=1 Tax=Pseudomonas shahriarae TaxID=2745512 RepID=A0ABT5NC14_9PSED|nr:MULTISPECIES: ATP-binding protein [Pseudomonas]MDD0979361.1 histidine kinase [Pseudomonas shahriarae]MDD0986098.1 histidine kinase [Pseudomonas shahriarae]MDD1033335.1 histidine kinase [Pseudomonas shahriarae]MDD1130563.1 histidine kinase [Pseudomonas shahriarae]NMY30534.1 HAMP domain-containing protein [Pseudomonas sp. WS 5412]